MLALWLRYETSLLRDAEIKLVLFLENALLCLLEQ